MNKKQKLLFWVVVIVFIIADVIAVCELLAILFRYR